MSLTQREFDAIVALIDSRAAKREAKRTAGLGADFFAKHRYQFQGAEGAAGRPGANGKPGPKGERGARGERGERGAPGPEGKPGLQGKRGARGAAGRPGAQGKPGARGDAGGRGWSPVLGLQSDGERIVLRVVDWAGGEGAKPNVLGYVGPGDTLTQNIKEAINVRGPMGAPGAGVRGPRGPMGPPGPPGSGGGSGGETQTWRAQP